MKPVFYSLLVLLFVMVAACSRNSPVSQSAPVVSELEASGLVPEKATLPRPPGTLQKPSM